MRLSLQSHKYRAEHWFIVSGNGLAELNSKKFIVYLRNSIDIPIGAKHRIGCSSESPLVFVEVQTGTSFEESDTTRYSNDFNSA
jgi:mannose-6-phosphate isomerase